MNAKPNAMIIFSFISSVLAMVFFGFFLYITPYVLFGLHYDVPEFVTHMAVYFKDHHDLDGFLFTLLMLLPLLAGAILFAYIGRKLSDSVKRVRIDDAVKTRVVKQVPTTAADDDETRQVTYSVKTKTTEIINDAGEVIGIETGQPELIAEESKPELFETDPHSEPIKYSKSDTLSFAVKLGILIVAVVLLIVLGDFLLRADMAHVMK